MKVLILADGIYPFVMGGMQKHSYSLAKSLSFHGIEVHVIHFHSANAEVDTNQNLAFVDFNKNKTSFTAIPFPKKIKIPGHYLRSNLEFSKQAWMLIKDNIHQFDFIYAQGFTGYHFIKEKKKNNHSVPIGVNFHGFEMFQKAPNFKIKIQHQLFRKTVKWICKNSDTVISYGGKITTIISTLGIPKSKILESPMGIDDTWFKTDMPVSTISNPIKFLFIGRFERRKGVEELTDAINRLINSHPKAFEFHFIGPIPEKNKINNKQIIYHGQLGEQAKIQEISKQCDLLICPSYSEGMPTVILEGMASGNAIIATDVGAVSLMINENGWLIPNPEVNTIYSSMVNAINENNESLIKMKENSYQLAKNKFRWSIVVTDLINQIKNITK